MLEGRVELQIGHLAHLRPDVLADVPAQLDRPLLIGQILRVLKGQHEPGAAEDVVAAECDVEPGGHDVIPDQRPREGIGRAGCLSWLHETSRTHRKHTRPRASASTSGRNRLRGI